MEAKDTVIFKLPDCVECGLSPMCNDICYEKTRVEDAQEQAKVSFQAGMKKVVEWATLNSDITCNPRWQAKLEEWGLWT